MRHRSPGPLTVALAGVLLVLVACAGGSGHLTSGVSGKVTAGPTCPVVTNPPNPACAARPVPGAVLVMRDANGSEVARVTAGQDGSFALKLAPGRYRLVPQPVEGLMGTAPSIDFTVEAGRPTTEVQVSYDTGIR
jgi:hypothetical protein